MVHPRKLTCPLKRDYLSREYIFQPLIFRGHASFQGSTCFFFLFFPCFLMFLFLGLFSFPRAKTSPLSRDEPWLPRLLGGSGSTKACWTGYPFQEMGFWRSKNGLESVNLRLFMWRGLILAPVQSIETLTTSLMMKRYLAITTWDT